MSNFLRICHVRLHLKRELIFIQMKNWCNVFPTFSKLILQLCVADGFRCRAHLSQDLLQTTHATDDAP